MGRVIFLCTERWGLNGAYLVIFFCVASRYLMVERLSSNTTSSSNLSSSHLNTGTQAERAVSASVRLYVQYVYVSNPITEHSVCTRF